MTAVVHPRDALGVLHLLEQCLRRHLVFLRAVDDQLVLHTPGVGRLLVTEELARVRIEFVSSPERAPAAVAAMDEKIRSLVNFQSLTIDWTASTAIPAALR